ncbi:metalloregulator ArsR/SmtB family transcription factor [Arthrobacter sp. LAPM80]|uniref:ArsR/SmtB family transcription factor n=1 Tax=Arthrobacter sp. LAPM80 TaxID=3141788 RepID=UPI00398A5CC8
MVAEKVFAVIAESTRRDILEALAQESKAVGQLVDELGVSQPTVSKHLRVLREAGVVTMRAQGQKRFYGINTAPLGLVSAWLETLGAAAAAPTAAPVAPASTASVAPDAKVRKIQDHPAVAAPTAPAPAVSSTARAATSKPAPMEESAVKELPVKPDEKEAPGAGQPAHPAANASPPAGGTAGPTSVPSREVAAIVQSNENDGGVQSQISRSVGRAANKAADLLANLPTLPTFRRRKD